MRSRVKRDIMFELVVSCPMRSGRMNARSLLYHNSIASHADRGPVDPSSAIHDEYSSVLKSLNLGNRQAVACDQTWIVQRYQPVHYQVYPRVQYASTHHGSLQQVRQPAGHLTCVRHGTYLRGGVLEYSSTGSGCDPPVHPGHPLTAILTSKATVFGIPKRTRIGIRRTNHQPIDRSGLTPASRLRRSMGQRGTQQEPQTHFPRYGSPHTANMWRATATGSSRKTNRGMTGKRDGH
ncbi:hypothetical protein TNCV_1792851 [Trichonephila clavipes]|nr:hypothetical protein TNCV_1792851 [Trichonephila clavipes]